MKITKLLTKILLIVFTITFSLQGVGQQNNLTGKLDKAPDFNSSRSGPILFDQMYNPGTGFMVSQHYSTSTNSSNTCAAADDFDVPTGETWNVHSIGIIGSYWQGAAGGGDTLNVYLLADDDGKPGDTIQEYFAHTDFFKEESLVGQYIVTYFEIFLPSMVTFNEGTYWVSVQMYSDYNTTGQWGWMDHNYETAIYGSEWHWINPKDGWGMGFTEWTPANLVVGPWLSWELSFALFGEPQTNDLAVLSINSPDDYYNSPPLEEQEVKILIKNEGLEPQTGFDLKYNFDGNEVIENIGSVILNFNETYEYTFTQTIDLSAPGAYDLSVWTMLAGDENPDNDEQSMEITVFDPTIYLMPSMQTTSITTCSGTFADAGGLEGNLTVDDWGILTIYPATAGAKIRLDFIQFDIAWSEFRIYDGENVNAPELGYWEDDISPGTITASYQNTSGALTIHFVAQGWGPFEAPGWAANIICHNSPEDDFEVMKIELSHPAVFEYDYVTAYATIKNIGTTILEKDVTFTANGVEFGTVTTGMVTQSDTVVVEVIWNPELEGEYELTASVPEDEGEDDNNAASMIQQVFPFDYFYEGFELPQFPPDGWTQSGTLWTHHDYSPAVGEGHAYIWADYGLFDTLYTPKLHIETGDKISFYSFSSPWWPGELDLCWINAETGEANLIEAVPIPWMDYQYFEIDVSEAAGDNYLGFVGKYNPAGGQGEVKLDEVTGIGIERFFYENDLKAYTLEGNITPQENITTTFNVEIKNIGSEFQSGTEYSLKLIQEPGIELMSYNGQDINPKEVLTFTLDYTFPDAGLYQCYVEIDFAEDQDISNNNSTQLDVYVQQEGTELVEIGSGLNGDFETNWYYPIITQPTGLYSQTLYLAEDMGEPNTITGIMYYYQLNENYPVNDIPITIWMTETEEMNMSEPLEAANDYYLAFDGTVDFQPGRHGVYIPLDFVYNYQGGNLMVTTYKNYTELYWGSSTMGISHVDDIMVRYYNGYENNQPIDPYDQQSLDSVYLHQKTEYANTRFFKFNLEGQYCIPQTINGTNAGDYIDGVIFNEIENLNTGSQGGPAYNDYTSLSTNVERDRSYELTIQAETSGTNGSIAAWIDFNGNQELDDEGERVMHISSSESSQELTVLVNIPEDASLGLTVLRVRNSADPALFTSCQAVDYGETEDYSINIIETIQVYNPVLNFSTELTDNLVDLNWNVPENPGIAYIEGFEMSTWPPQNTWEVKQSTSLGGTLIDPTGETWVQYDNDMQYVYNGAFSALCPASSMDFNWLITPETQLYGNDELNFMLNYSSDVNGFSKFYVLVEADGTWNTVLEYSDEVTMYNNYDEQITVSLGEFAGKLVRLAFVSEYNDAYPIAIDDIIIKGVDASGKSVSGISGYEIYKNGELFANIDNPANVEFTDELTETENYEYCIFALYDDGEKSEEACDEVFYLAPLTPPLNVIASADNNDVNVIWTAPNGGMMRFEDDFENYNPGGQVACQNPDDWTTWTLEPCSMNDPYIVTEMTYSGENSVAIEGEADLLYLTDEMLSEGKYSYNFRIYIPEGFNGYFNVLQDHDLTIGALWGLQVFFDVGGIGTLDGGGYGAAAFTYEYNEWMYIEIIVDMDTDWAKFSIDAELIHEWQWSSGISGGGGWNTLEGGDFYAWNSNNTCKYFIDDFQLVQLYDSDDLVNYNVYKDDALIGNTTVNEYQDVSAGPGYHNYCISAVYDEGESDQICDFVTLFSAPENFTADVQNENDVYCSWEEVIGGNILGYKVYRNDELVSDLITNNEWIDEGLEGGLYTYYVTSVYNEGESLPSNIEIVVILISPKNLVADAIGDDIVLNWEAVGEVQQGEMVELYQHDSSPENGLYQWFDFGYGVVFDLSAYPNAVIEMADFYHSSYGITGTWSYMLHIVDWNTFTEINAVGPFQTTGNDVWELEIPLGSISGTTNLVGIFLEPMSNDPQDAYPILACDGILEGYSLECSLEDYSINNPAPGDFLLDLWIWTPYNKQVVKAKKVKVNNLNITRARNPYTPVDDEVSTTPKDNLGKALLGYNIYYSYESDPFEFLDSSVDTTYLHAEAGNVYGNHYYYVTALYEEGESLPSNTAHESIGIQTINLVTGYQFVSSRFIPENPDMLVVVEEILNENLDFIRNSNGQMIRKIGPNWVNGIGDWVVSDGYLVKMFADDSFTINGTLVDPATPISVVTGYQFVSYFPTTPMDALIAYETIIGDDLDFIRNSNGQMIRKIGPNWVNGIGDCNPGEGYLIKMFADGEIIYPALAKSSGKIPSVPTYFTFEGGNAADPVYTLYLKGLEIGDEVAAYDGDIMLGATKINSQNAFENELPVFSTLIDGQGYEAGNPIILKVWSGNTVVSTDFAMESIFNSYVSDVYPGNDGVFSVVKVNKNTSVTSNELVIYPNPATNLINIVSQIEIVNIKVYNHVGQSVYEAGVNNLNVQINTNNFESGVYIVKIETCKGLETQKFIIK